MFDHAEESLKFFMDKPINFTDLFTIKAKDPKDQHQADKVGKLLDSTFDFAEHQKKLLYKLKRRECGYE